MTPGDLTGLKAAVERKFGKPLNVHSDFESLGLVFNNVLSTQTLKRVWGYNKDYQNVSIKTADILAQYVGSNSYQDFLTSNSFKTLEQCLMYDASKIAVLAERIHSERYTRAEQLMDEHKYSEALELLSTIDDEAESLTIAASPFIESALAVVTELCLKAQAIWNCNYSSPEAIPLVEEVLERALPVAKKVNDHLSLWFIYQNWAFWLFQHRTAESEDADIKQVLNLYELSIRQGKILQLENPDEAPVALISSLNDKAYTLTEIGRYEEAVEIIEDALTLELEELTEAYLLTNLAKVSLLLEKEEDYITIYEVALDLISKYHSENKPINESVCLEALCNYNLGIMHQDLLEEPDIPISIEYYKKAIELFNCQDIPNTNHLIYKEDAQSRLTTLTNV